VIIFSMPRFLIHPAVRWLPAGVWMLIIFWFSAQSHLPSASDPLLELVLKKGAHVAAYAVLGLCYLWGLGAWRYRWAALLLAIVYAIGDEYHQSWTPERHPSWIDVGIDAVGATIGLWGIAPWLTWSLQKQFKIGLIVAPQQAPDSTAQPLDGFIAKPEAQHRPNNEADGAAGRCAQSK
jgi:VanZ family protein